MNRIDKPVNQRGGAPDASLLAGGRLDDAVIAALPPFDMMSETEVAKLLDVATVRRIEPDDTYFHEGDDADNFYVLLNGFLRIVRTTEDGEQVTVLHIAPGQLFGIAKAFGSETYHSTARAASKGIALSWPSDLWDQFIADHPGFKSATRLAVGARVGELQEKIVEMATKRVEQRIALAILRLVELSGKETAEGLEIDFPITRQDISEMTGTTLHSVSRCMSQWQKAGIIKSARKRVIVCQPDALPV